MEKLKTKLANFYKNLEMTPVSLIIVFCVAMGASFGIYNSSVVNNLEAAVVYKTDSSHYGYNQTLYIVENSSLKFFVENNEEKLSQKTWSLLVASFHIGSGISTLFTPILAEKAGRRNGNYFCLEIL